MYFNELDNESRRRLIDVQQRAAALRDIGRDLNHRFAGYMAWKRRNSQDYLYRRIGRVEKSLGHRSPETEAIHTAFTSGKAALEERFSSLRHALETMARVNRALGLGRIPSLMARILRRLDDARVLGEQVCVVGTNALFAYEAHVGIRFETGILATDDIDLALDSRRNLTLTARAMPDGLLGLLRKVDRSFASLGSDHFRAINNAGIMVDLITPEPRNPMVARPIRLRRLGGQPSKTDLLATEVPRLEMIVDAPRFSSIAIAEDGLPVWIAAADPRWWAAHKLWLSSEQTREPIKRRRDGDQAKAVAEMLARTWPNADLSDTALAAIPAPVRQRLRDIVSETTEPDRTPQW
jgi:hypothetical protein